MRAKRLAIFLLAVQAVANGQGNRPEPKLDDLLAPADLGRKLDQMRQLEVANG